MAIINPPKVLREKLGDDGVDALVALVNMANDKQKEDVIVFTEEKFEKRLIQVKSDLELKIEQTKSDLELKIEQTKSELIKWMFIFWVGQTGLIIGVILALLKAK